MKNFKLNLMPCAVVILFFSLFFFSCSCDEDYDGSSKPISDIPSDGKAAANPIIPDAEQNAILPNIQFGGNDNKDEITINVTGIQDPKTLEWLDLYGTGHANQNVWVEVDDKPKGIVVFNKSSDTSKKVSVDLVFTVDNSGSMSQGADALANSIVNWATNLNKLNIDIKFGCVGYGYFNNDNSCGGINMTDLDGISNFFNRPGRSGVTRTLGFVGADSLLLLEASQNYKQAIYECGVEAIRFADSQFNFREGVTRVYLNFTDEPNQPKNKQDKTIETISVEWFTNQKQWNTTQGTIHTVYSDREFINEPGVNEQPWLMSTYTGGTVKFVNSSFTDVTLDDMPITDAMKNSYMIRFVDNSSIVDGLHKVKVTVLSEDGNVKVSRTFTDVKFGNK